MKKISDILRKKQVLYPLIALAGFVLGWLLFSPSSSPESAGGTHAEAHSSGTTEGILSEPPIHDTHGSSHDLVQDESGVWTCSMHPQIRQDKPGKCPICGMDLIPLKKNVISGGDAVSDPDAIRLSDEAMALADVQTTRVSRSNPVKQVRLYGKIIPDERSLQSQTAYVGGRIERLDIEFTGETVRAGQTLATLYSPELFTAQQELLEAVRMQQPALVQAAREKLRLWNLTDAQIDAIQYSGQASPMVEIKSNTNGIVIAKRVNRGDYVSQGSILFDIANLSRVWAMFDAFEVDLPFLAKGDRVEFTLSAFPGKTYSGRISFIDPILNATTRTARVRVDVANPTLEMKPEMYATAQVAAPLKGYKDRIVVPQTAVLWTGKRAVVYVRLPDTDTPTFRMREVTLGPALGGAYVVLDGLSDDEEIVTNGVFSIDASAQLEGKRSMMNEDTPGTAPMTGHQGHSMSGMSGSHAVSQESEHVLFAVRGSCDMCKERIETAAKGVSGVRSAHWDREKQMIHLQLDPSETSADAVAKAIAAAGHDTDKYKAVKAVYDTLPGCCKYRDE